MKKPNDLRMANRELEHVLADLDVESKRSARREPPPSQSTKLRVLNQLDFRSETLGRFREFGPLIVALSSVVTMVIAVTLWTRSR
jgi:hypothetical protein